MLEMKLILFIPLLAEEGWRAAPGWSDRRSVSAELLLRLRPIGLALRALLCEEGSGHPAFPITMVCYGFQVGLFLFAARRSGDGDRATRAWIARWGKASGTAWGDRFG